jgi:hypothetical protein
MYINKHIQCQVISKLHIHVMYPFLKIQVFSLKNVINKINLMILRIHMQLENQADLLYSELKLLSAVYDY